MKPLYLFINTVNQNRPSFAAFDGNGHILCSYKFIDKQEDLVQGLGNFFKKEKMRLAEIKAVLAVSGPGSFSASRAGIILANSLNFINKTPVLSIKDTGPVRGDISNASNGAGDSTEELIKNNLSGLKRIKKTAEGEVYYQKEPNITT